ncbi:MAG: hypothetical protein Kow0069_33080 [Promethearchaeota archaeon]
MALDVFCQIVLIAAGMTAFSVLFQKFWGMNHEAVRRLQEKIEYFNKRLERIQSHPRVAQTEGPILQQEMMGFLKEVMQKQFIPMCVRTIIFLAVFGVVGAVYRDYGSGLLPFSVLFFGSGWVGVYVLFSFTFGLSVGIIRYAVRKARGQTGQRGGPMGQILMEFNRLAQVAQGIGLAIPSAAPGTGLGIPTLEREPSPAPATPAWKERLERKKKEREREESRAGEETG